MKWFDWVVVFVLLTIAFCCVFLIGWSQGSGKSFQDFKSVELENYRYDNSSACSSLDFPDDLYCYQKDLKSWYKYVKTNDEVTYSLEELKLYGGDCHNYALYWKAIAESKGYGVELVNPGINEKKAHLFAVIYNHKGYCVTDQTIVWCFIYPEDYKPEGYYSK